MFCKRVKKAITINYFNNANNVKFAHRFHSVQLKIEGRGFVVGEWAADLGSISPIKCYGNSSKKLDCFTK